MFTRLQDIFKVLGELTESNDVGPRLSANG
jgi:hypothetical protein